MYANKNYKTDGKVYYMPNKIFDENFSPHEFMIYCFLVSVGDSKPKHNQAAAYILMLNTGLRTAEALGLINSDIDLEKKVIHIQRGVKEAQKRDGTERKSGREIVVGKLKTASSKRIVPLNETAIQAIIELRNERYFGEDAPLIPDADGNFTRPLNLRKRFYSILDAAGLKKKGLHSLRHTFATKLVTGVRTDDGTVKALTPRQVADLLGHTTSEITEMYYVKLNTDMLMGVTNGLGGLYGTK